MIKFFIVNVRGFIFPIEYQDYSSACSMLDDDEIVIMAETAEELELCFEDWDLSLIL